MDDMTRGARYAHCAALWAQATAHRARQAHELDGMAARSLHQALTSMSPDSDIAARVIILTPDGELAGVAVLAAADVERLRLAAEDGAELQAAASGLAAEAEAWLRDGGDL